MAKIFLYQHFITFFLIVGFSVKLWGQRRAGDAPLRYYWLTVISTLILIAADTLESWAAEDPGLRFWRVLFSVIGYVMRPTAALSILLIVYPRNPRPRYLWAPCVVNTLIFCTAFFSPIAFSFDENYNFVRGPLGYFVFIVSFFYIFASLLSTWRLFRNKDHRGERFILYICAAACMITAMIDAEYGGSHINAAIMASSVFLYLFLQSYDTIRDPLTGQLTRQTFYEDCERYADLISAVGSVDMNGLKALNDRYGHEKGDEALKAIGKSLDEISGKNTFAYRIGGDEFALLFIRQDEDAVSGALEQLKARVREAGYTVSAGYAMRADRKETVKDLLRISDEKMYVEKAAYYTQNRYDRRRRR